MDACDFLSQICYTKKEIDAWFEGRAFPFANFDAELSSNLIYRGNRRQAARRNDSSAGDRESR